MPNAVCAAAWFGTMDRALIEAVSATAKRDPVVRKKKASSQSNLNLRRADKRLDVAGIERQGTFEIAARLGQVFPG
jgi:hypothetical protein